VSELLADLERRYPGMRFRMIEEQDRIRPHIRLFVNTSAVESLRTDVRSGDTLHLICALSGG
jgi:molybdopterin converting factor small subunit